MGNAEIIPTPGLSRIYVSEDLLLKPSQSLDQLKSVVHASIKDLPKRQLEPRGRATCPSSSTPDEVLDSCLHLSTLLQQHMQVPGWLTTPTAAAEHTPHPGGSTGNNSEGEGEGRRLVNCKEERTEHQPDKRHRSEGSRAERDREGGEREEEAGDPVVGLREVGNEAAMLAVALVGSVLGEKARGLGASGLAWPEVRSLQMRSGDEVSDDGGGEEVGKKEGEMDLLWASARRVGVSSR